MKLRTGRQWMEWVLDLYRAAPVSEPLPEQDLQKWLVEFRDFFTGVGRESDYSPELISRFQGKPPMPTLGHLQHFRLVVDEAVTKILQGGKFVSHSGASPSIDFPERDDDGRPIPSQSDLLAIELSTMDMASAAFNRLLSLTRRFHFLVKLCPQHTDPACLGVFLASKVSQKDCAPGCGSRRRVRVMLGIPEERFNKPGRPKKRDGQGG